MARPRLSEEKIALIRDLAAEDLSNSKIAKRANVSWHAARKYAEAIRRAGQEQKQGETIQVMYTLCERHLKDFLTTTDRLYRTGDAALMTRYIDDIISIIRRRTNDLITEGKTIYGLDNKAIYVFLDDLNTVIRYFNLRAIDPKREEEHISVREAVEP